MEDSNTRTILKGGKALRQVYMQKFLSGGAHAEKVREGIKKGGRQKQKVQFGPFFT